MRVGSLFSGIGGFDLGLERAGHEIVFQCESDPYRRRVLKRHWPGVPCFEDVHEVANGSDEQSRNGRAPERLRRSTQYGTGACGASRGTISIDLLCGGFPCQDLSVAGRRAGLAGERSSLFFEFARVADALLPDGGWVLIENVPGLLSSNRGRDFAVLLATLAELGFHDLAWRVLDSRYLRVPQRRRRVFILARRSGGKRASEVLLEPESGGGDFEAGDQTGQGSPASFGQGVAGTLGNRQSGGFRTTDLDNQGAYVAAVTSKWRKGSGGPAGDEAQNIIAAPLTKGSAAGEGVSYPGRRKEDDENLVVSEETDPDRVRAPSGVPGRVDSDPVTTHALTSRTGGAVTEDGTGRGAPLTVGLSEGEKKLRSPRPGYATGDKPLVFAESCALDPKPDGPRYAACGDAVTVNVAEWIGRRLMQYSHQNDHPIRTPLAGPSG